MTNKCWKGFAHIWEKEYETRWHEIYKCLRCKGRMWKLRRGIF